MTVIENTHDARRWAAYALWEKDVRRELRGILPHVNPSVPDICEDGSVFMGLDCILSRRGVTPWERSRHYMPLTPETD